MKLHLLSLVLLLCMSSLFAAKAPPVDPRTQELSRLKNDLLLARDSLQRDIATRWRNRQQSLEKRTADKEEMSSLSDAQEKIFNTLLVAKEEGYSLERRIEAAQRTLDEKKQAHTIIASALNETFEKEAAAISGMFPLDADSARLALETIRQEYGKKSNSMTAIRQLSDYCAERIMLGTIAKIANTPLLPDGEAAQLMKVARFGTVFAYGTTESGTWYTIGQSGRDGADRYRIRRIDNSILAKDLAPLFGGWGAGGPLTGLVPMDIMQSDLSGELVSGEKTTLLSKFKTFVKAGGPVMLPLGLLPLWVFVLVLIKLVQYFGRRGSTRKSFTLLMTQFEKGGCDGLRSAIGSKRGSAYKIAHACSDSSIQSRKGAESAAREVVFGESAHLGSHLNTLAVIAGVAPLLGLLGTVTGMIRLFEVITRFGTGDPKLLAGGISEALITTEVGLIIAVPVLLVHNFLRNYKNGITAELQAGALRIVNRLFPEG